MKAWILSLALAFSAACSSTPTSRLPAATDAFAPPDISSMVPATDSEIALLDILEVKVYNVTQFDGAYQVQPDGNINMPLLGPVEAAGYSVFELGKVLEAKLQESYLQNPLVTVRIAEAYGHKYTTEGAVRTPGPHPVRGKLTLMEALSSSGGLAPNANPKAIVIFRTIEGERRAARFDLNKIRSGDAEDPLIYGNDIVLVDSREPNPAYQETLRAIPLVGLFFAVF